jgi:hypothetical protein
MLARWWPSPTAAVGEPGGPACLARDNVTLAITPPACRHRATSVPPSRHRVAIAPAVPVARWWPVLEEDKPLPDCLLLTHPFCRPITTEARSLPLPVLSCPPASRHIEARFLPQHKGRSIRFVASGSLCSTAHKVYSIRLPRAEVAFDVPSRPQPMHPPLLAAAGPPAFSCSSPAVAGVQTAPRSWAGAPPAASAGPPAPSRRARAGCGRGTASLGRTCSLRPAGAPPRCPWVRALCSAPAGVIASTPPTHTHARARTHPTPSHTELRLAVTGYAGASVRGCHMLTIRLCGGHVGAALCYAARQRAHTNTHALLERAWGARRRSPRVSFRRPRRRAPRDIDFRRRSPSCEESADVSFLIVRRCAAPRGSTNTHKHARTHARTHAHAHSATTSADCLIDVGVAP